MCCSQKLPVGHGSAQAQNMKLGAAAYQHLVSRALNSCAKHQTRPPLEPKCGRLLCRESLFGEASGSPAGGARWPDVESLLHHWQELDDSRKMLFAQMAVLTR
jgi:hypothetical protein